MTFGIPVAVLRSVQHCTGRGGAAHRVGQRDEANSGFLAERGKSGLQVPGLPLPVRTSRRECAQVGVDPELDWDVINHQIDSMLARNLGALNQCCPGYLESLKFIFANGALGIEIEKVKSMHHTPRVAEPAETVDAVRDQRIAPLATLHEDILRERPIDELTPPHRQRLFCLRRPYSVLVGHRVVIVLVVVEVIAFEEKPRHHFRFEGEGEPLENLEFLLRSVSGNAQVSDSATCEFVKTHTYGFLIGYVRAFDVGIADERDVGAVECGRVSESVAVDRERLLITRANWQIEQLRHVATRAPGPVCVRWTPKRKLVIPDEFCLRPVPTGRDFPSHATLVDLHSFPTRLTAQRT